MRRIINKIGAPTALHFTIIINSEQPVPKFSAESYPHRSWAACAQCKSGNNSEEAKTSHIAVTDAFVCEINNAFTYCQVHLSPLGFHVLRIINQTCSYGQPVLESSEWLTETFLAQWWPTTPLLGGGKPWAKATLNADGPFEGGGSWLEGFPEPVKGPLCK